jgi:hypothetical protein
MTEEQQQVISNRAAPGRFVERLVRNDKRRIILTLSDLL